MQEQSSAQVDEFRWLIQDFVRRFGFLSEDATPCGQPIPVACAHALQLLDAERGRALPQAALLAHFAVDKSNVSRLVARLVEMGFVRCRPDDSDRRGKWIELTPKGARMAEKLKIGSRERFGRLLRDIPASKRGPVVAALGELVRALSRLDPGFDTGVVTFATGETA
jgi:DNA-binding MarR family transcriptional regulator